MIYLPEYHSRFAKVMCLVLVILISAMFYCDPLDHHPDHYALADQYLDVPRL
jgi:hypothetical protein